MMLRDELLIIASLLRSGDAGAYHQQVASRRLARIADDVRRMEQQLDGIVGDAQDASDSIVAAAQSERALVPLRAAQPRFRLVSR